MDNHHYNKNLKQLARQLRSNSTKAENKLWYDLLSNKEFGGYKFLRQRSIDNFIVDFYCKELYLVIEVDGRSHEFDDIAIKDIARDKKLKSLGISVIRFSDWEVMNNLGSVQELLWTRILEIEEQPGPS